MKPINYYPLLDRLRGNLLDLGLGDWNTYSTHHNYDLRSHESIHHDSVEELHVVVYRFRQIDNNPFADMIDNTLFSLWSF